MKNFYFYLNREFSDCAVGVLDKAFNEDNMRTFEMLDEKHPVSIYLKNKKNIKRKFICLGLESYGHC
jgi:hypothetical protein